uniref:Triokinase/FMN cyclase n=1 Tax=Romanomermis culicivorax TaxID=13658 RepID=A0A915JFE8_ROMCU
MDADDEKKMSITKKMINDPDQCVDENLLGFAASHQFVKKIQGYRILVRADIEQFRKSKKVSLISGGGSGHEPMFAGFVGEGCLTAAVAGPVFTSPPPSQILQGLKMIDNGVGILVLIINYTGDRLNFGIAIQKFNQISKTPIRSVIVADDCALKSKDRSAGRRGLAGTVLVLKKMITFEQKTALNPQKVLNFFPNLVAPLRICGAMANAGLSLDEIVNTASKVVNNTGTIGLSMSSCSIPNRAPMFKLGAKEMELGLGIHGEPGVKRTDMQTAHTTVKIMIDHMLDEKSNTRIKVGRDDQVAIVLNNLGGLSQIEMGILSKEVIFYTNAPATCAVWRPLLQCDNDQIDYHNYEIQPVDSSDGSQMKSKSNVPNLSSPFGRCLLNVCNKLCEKESYLNELDSFCGDGDCGTTIKLGSSALKTALHNDTLSVNDPAKFIDEISILWQNSTGGTAGAIYSLFLSAIAKILAQKRSEEPKTWLTAFVEGTEMIMTYTMAKPGDRTMIDPLAAAAEFFKKELYNDSFTVDEKFLDELAKIVHESALSTKDMIAKAGRASYVAKANLTHPDPGAMAVDIWFNTITNFLKEELIE